MKIWIDPNGGADYDKIQVSCEFRSKISWTCIYPQKYLVIIEIVPFILIKLSYEPINRK